MHKGNVKRGVGVASPRSWRKCKTCGKILKGDRANRRHNEEKHS